jgi:hypothetical protein
LKLEDYTHEKNTAAADMLSLNKIYFYFSLLAHKTPRYLFLFFFGKMYGGFKQWMNSRETLRRSAFAQHGMKDKNNKEKNNIFISQSNVPSSFRKQFQHFTLIFFTLPWFSSSQKEKFFIPSFATQTHTHPLGGNISYFLRMKFVCVCTQNGSQGSKKKL